MKTTLPFLLAVFLMATFSLFSQVNSNLQTSLSINVDGSAADTSSMLHVQSTSKGMLTPRMGTSQRTAIATPANGLLVYDTDTKSFWYYDHEMWNEISTTMAVPGEESSSAPSLAIPDGNPVGVSDTITLTQSGIFDPNMRFNVCINITHPWTAALDISLTGPDGTTIDLSSDNGGSGDNYINTCFTTAANASITTGFAPFTGNWIPEEPFSNFYTKPIAGPWILKVVDDDFNVDNGTFNSWSIEITPAVAAPSLLSDKDGDTGIQVEKTPDDDRIRFDVAGQEAMIIQQDRKVRIISGPSGLGTIPESILSLERNSNGYLNFLTPNNAESGILFGNPADGPAAGGIIYNSQFLRNGLQFRTNGNINRMVIDSLGRMGIGFSLPTAPLMIRATSDVIPTFNGLYVFNDLNNTDHHAILCARVAGANAGDPFVSLDVANESGWTIGVDNSDNNKLKIANAWSNVNQNTRMTLHQNGSVGIGTIDPLDQLHITGDFRVDGGDIKSNGGIWLRPDMDMIGGDNYVWVVGRGGINQIYSNVTFNVRGIAGNLQYFRVENPAGFALFYVDNSGNVAVTNNLSKGGGSFKIDHPLDPENKYLYHSFVESPDMMNIYNGNVTTDAGGLAEVELPAYFTTLNKDYRYQLTVIGTFAQAIVKEEVANNRFVIQTNQPNVKVSWQVTGIRQDPYANQNRIEVEVEKPTDKKGTYLHPSAYGQPLSKSERQPEQE